MAKVPSYYSTLQAKKPDASHRIYHNNDRCFPGRGIPLHERVTGDAGYRLCVECARLDEVALPAAAPARRD